MNKTNLHPYNVFLKIDNDVLIGSIVFQTCHPNAEYAFYLERNGKQIEKHWYSNKPYIHFASSPEPGRYRAIGFVRYRGESNAQMLASPPLLHKTSPPVGNLLTDVSALSGSLNELRFMLPKSGSIRLDLHTSELPYAYQTLLIRQPGKRLFVILGGAVANRSTITLPRFNRFSWAADFPGSVLCIADPTLKLGDLIRLGWYFGSAENDATSGLVQVVESFANALGHERRHIVTYGSSGGGFAAMQVAARIGEGATAIAINAQTNILDYAQKSAVDEFLSVCTDGMDITTARTRFINRLSLADAWSTPTSARARCLLLQNISDRHHLNNHLLPFAAKLNLAVPGSSVDGRICIMLYDYPNGHGAEPRTMLPLILDRMSKLNLPA